MKIKEKLVFVTKNKMPPVPDTDNSPFDEAALIRSAQEMKQRMMIEYPMTNSINFIELER